MIVLLVLPAHAQRGLGKRSAGSQPSTTPEEQRQKHEQQQQERAYKAASDKIPVKKPVDPWANMRWTARSWSLAEALGLDFVLSLQQRADEVIE